LRLGAPGEIKRRIRQEYVARIMKPQPVVAQATSHRPNRILIVLAAAWMIVSLALGGAVTAESRETTLSETVTTATQP
jgi:hypothetical protein